MINTILPIADIQYETVIPNPEFIDSIRKRGVVIPVIVECIEGGYRCHDGRKRLSACALLAKENAEFSRIPVMILNDFSRAGSGFWGNTKRIH